MMKCHYCEFSCDLSKGEGVCRMYREDNGKIAEIHPFEWVRCDGMNVERIPVYHFYPGARILQLGSFNCNASCAYCINASIAIRPEGEVEPFVMSAEEIVEAALKGGYQMIHFGINEVTVNLPSALETARLARQKGLLVGCSTNGFMSAYAADLMAAYFDFFNVSLKSIRDDFYRQHLKLPSVKPVMRNIEFFVKSGAHVEVTTPIVNRNNEDEIPQIADFLSALDKDMAWHIFRLIPENMMSADDVPDVRRVAELITQAKEKLFYIYFGNFIGSNWVDTICKNCGEMVIERLCDCACGARLMANRLSGNKCPACGFELPVKA